MENSEKIHKIHWPYLLLNILGPLAVMVLLTVLGVILPQRIGALVTCLGFGLAVLWWALLSHKLYEKTRGQRVSELKESGFVCSHTFDADNSTVLVDLVHAQVALIFRWNPDKVYIRPASALSHVRVDDGCHGAGMMAGSSCVSFLFTVDGVKVRVNTFTSNRRWQMDSDYILTGISKADVMVEALAAAGAARQ